MSWYDMDWAELPEVTLLRRHKLQAGARVFDIGAHQGVVALMLAQIVGPKGEVIAVEPEPRLVRIARKNRELNRAEQLQILEAAVTDYTGPLVIDAPRDGELGSLEEWAMLGVKAVSVDHLAHSYGMPDVIFIDVDGPECAVLRGARDTLQSRPDCFVEVHVGVGLEKQGGSVAQVMSYFPAETYDSFIASEENREFMPFDASSPLLKARFFLVAIAHR